MQISILAPGTTVASSADVVVAAGEAVTIGLYVAAGTVPSNANFTLFQKTPGADVHLADLAPRESVVISGAGTYYVKRLQGGTNEGDAATQIAVGVFKEQG